MKNHTLSILLFLLCTFHISCQSQSNSSTSEKNKKTHNIQNDSTKVRRSNSEWQKILSPEVYNIARMKGTERPFTSPFETSKEIGTFYCKACGNPLFRSDAKYESGCGWPSFFEPISKTSILEKPDNSLGMRRIEVICGRCDSHLGHVFDDGPPPSGLRYCINGVILSFEKKD